MVRLAGADALNHGDALHLPGPLGFGYQQMAIGGLIVLAVSVDALARRAAGT